MDGSLLRVRSISKHFGGICAVNNVHLDVPNRTFIGLVGPNGCGKTTLLNTIFGFYRPDNGNIYFGTSYGNDGSFYALYPNGTLKWKYHNDDDVTTSPTIGNDGVIYFGDHNKKVR